MCHIKQCSYTNSTRFKHFCYDERIKNYYMEIYHFGEKPTAKEITNQSSNKPTSQPTDQF